MTRGLTKGKRTFGPASVALLALAALSLPANLAIIAVFYWAGSHQNAASAAAATWALAGVAVILSVMGSMLWSLRRGRTGLSLALAGAQLLPTLLLGANLAFVALR